MCSIDSFCAFDSRAKSSAEGPLSPRTSLPDGPSPVLSLDRLMKRQKNSNESLSFGLCTSKIILVQYVKDTLSTHAESEGAANVATGGAGCCGIMGGGRI